jgi:hypothetical protein
MGGSAVPSSRSPRRPATGPAADGVNGGIAYVEVLDRGDVRTTLAGLFA